MSYDSGIPAGEPMTDKELREIEARAEKATPGPWRRWVGNLTQMVSVMRGTEWDEVVHWTGFNNSHFSGNRRANGAFIAHSRTDVPRLVAEVRRLRGQPATVCVIPAGPEASG